MNQKPIGGELAEFVIGLSYDDLPSRVIVRAKWLVLDLLGAAIMGQRHPASEAVRSSLQTMASSGRSTAIHHGTRICAPWAAFANAAFCQVHDVNDGHVTAGAHGGFSHPGRNVIPPALALGEGQGISGRELIAAVVVGYEVMCRVRGHAPKPPTGAYGAAAVSSRILRLSPGDTLQAMGMAGQLYPTNHQYLNGSDANHMMSGYIARLGVECATMVDLGASGPSIYDDSTRTTRYRARGLGCEYEILRIYTKPYPTCRDCHGAIDASLQLRAENTFSLSDVAYVNVYVPTRSLYVAERCITPTSSHKSCQFNLLYAVAVALLDSEVWEKQFAATRIADPKVHELISRVHVFADDTLDSVYLVESDELHAPVPAVVEIGLSDGTAHSCKVFYPKGHPSNPLSQEEAERKFRAESEASLGRERSEKVMEVVLGLENTEDLDVLMCLLR